MNFSVNSNDTTSNFNNEGNISVSAFENATDAAEQPEEKPELFFVILHGVIAPITFGAITISGLVGNSLVVYVIIARGVMQNKTNIMLFNLALADIAFLLICPTFTAYQYMYSADIISISETFYEVLCKVMHYLLNVTLYVTIYTLVLISVVRYLGILYTNKADRYITKKSLIVALCGIWITTLCANAPLISIYRIKQNVCNHYKINFAQELYTTFFIFAYLLPLSIIAVLSMGIWRHMRNNGMTTQRESLKRQAKVERHLVVIVAVFAVFMLPIQFMLLLAYWGYLKFTPTVEVFFVLSQSLAYSNSCLNPVIYNFTSKDFRQHFNEILCCVCRKCRNSHSAAVINVCA